MLNDIHFLEVMARESHSVQHKGSQPGLMKDRAWLDWTESNLHITWHVGESFTDICQTYLCIQQDTCSWKQLLRHDRSLHSGMGM